MTKPVLESKRKINLLRAAAVIWILLILTISLLPGQYYIKITQFSANAIISLWNLVFASQENNGQTDLVYKITFFAFIIACYALLALILYFAHRVKGIERRLTLIRCGIYITVIAAADELLRMVSPGLTPKLSRLLFNILGGIAALFAAELFQRLLRRYPRALNRETISYVFFGVLTTLVNLFVYGLGYNNLGLPNLISNAVAWVAAVLFAYAVNKLFVFRSHTETAEQTLKEFRLFIAARLFSLVADELMMWLMVDIAHINSGVSKIAANIVVLVMNYFFSKRIIFNTKESIPDKK